MINSLLQYKSCPLKFPLFVIICLQDNNYNNAPPGPSADKVDRSANVIFFGIPDKSLLDTRSLVDEICTYCDVLSCIICMQYIL